jgi:hypothetical protein
MPQGGLVIRASIVETRKESRQREEKEQPE